MRPKKKILIYHPKEHDGALFCYAMNITLFAEVFLASSLAKCTRPATAIEVTVIWKKSSIEIRNLFAKTCRTLPIQSSNLDLMEAVRIGLARKRGCQSIHKDREEKRVAVVVTRVRDVVKEINRVERMMEIVSPRKRRCAA